MKINKLIFILFIILMLLLVSSVNASDNLTDSDMVSLDDGNAIYVDVQGDDSSIGSKDFPVLTIDKAISISNENGTVYLSNGEFKNVLNNKLTINKSLNFIGAEDTTINGLNNDYIFEVQDNVCVSFKNIKFINAYKSPESYSINYNQSVYGAALEIKDATVTIDNCSFIGNVLSYGSGDNYIYGGAISNFGDLTILNSYFTNNTALSTSGLYSYGGSIYNKGELSIYNTTFSKSKSVDFGYGAAIANDGNLLIENSVISNSIALHECMGSAIYNTGDLMLLNSIIENNYIERAKFNYIFGAIYNSGSLTARGNIFRNNTGYYEAPTPYYKGSPNIYNSGKLNLTYNAFIDNSPFDGISTDLYYNGGDIITLDNNWWNTNENPYKVGSKINVEEKLTSWLIFNLTPDYSKLNISDSITINAAWTNNIGLLTQLDLIPVFNVTFKTNVNGKEIISNKQLINGQADFKFNYTQNKGLYEVTNTLESFSQNVLVDVGKIFTYVNFNVTDNITFMDDLNISVEVVSTDKSIPTGVVLLMLNDDTYTVDLQNGKGSCTISGFDPQKYTLNIVYNGTEDYFKAFNKTEININKLDVDMKLNITDIKVSQTGFAIVTLGPKGVQGQSILFVDGVRKKVVYLYNGNTTISLSKFAEGEYNITLQFVETKYYNSVNVSGIFKVTRFDSSINISAYDINVGENATITINVSPDTLRGDATLIINGVENTIFIDNSTTNVTLTDLESGMYNVTLIFDGNLRYYPVNTSTSFEVARTPTSLIVDITEGKNLNGTIKVRTSPTNCSGVMGVYINYNLYKLNFTNGEAEFAVKFDKGTNYVFVFYEGNKYYEDSSWNTTLGVEDEFVFIGENSTSFANNDFNYSVRLIELNGIPMPKRTVTVDFNGVKYNIVTNDDGFAFLPLNLDSGEYNIKATYKDVTISNTLFVKKVDFNLTVSDITYGEIEEIKAIFENGVTGNVNFIMNDLNLTVVIVNGTASYNCSNLDVGTYNLKAIYQDVTHSAEFLIKKADLNLNISVSPATSNVDEIIEVSILENVTGELTFVFKNKEYKVQIKDNKAILNLSKLNEGNYRLTVKYAGDKNYNPVESNVDFRIKEFTSDLNITINDAYYAGDLIAIANLNEDATGIVRFDVANISKSVEIIEGKAIWNFTGLDVGRYNITANYLGNTYYVSSTNSTSFNVLKANSTIELYVKEVALGENIRIYTNLSPNATGNVSYSMIGYFSPRNKPISDSKSSWYIAPMNTGEYTVIAKYLGDKNYYPSNTTFILNVSQKKSILDVELDDTRLSDRVICKIRLYSKDGEPLTSDVTLKVGSSTYTVNIEDGSGVFVLGKLAAGNYSYEVEYAGDENYTSAICTGNFKVVDDLFDVKLTANNLTKYYHGSEKLQISLKNSNGNPLASQEVQFRFALKTYYLITDSNGKASLDINLNPGKYNVSIFFEETDMYHSALVNVVVEVLSTVEGIDIVKLHGSSTQYYAIFSDSNGKPLSNTVVKFTIGSKSYSATTLVNGIVRLNINLNAGNYTITAINPVTSQKYSNKIVIVNRLMENKNVNKYYRGTQSYSVRAYGDDGKVACSVYVKIKVNGKTYSVKTDDRGYATLPINLNPGKYTITSTYKGYSVSNSVNVKSTIVTSNLSKKKSKTTTFQAKLLDTNGKILKGKTVIFKFKGKSYSIKTNSKGIATLTIKTTLNVGSYKIYTTYGKLTRTNTITIKR